MFRGNHPATVDPKGRLKVPAAFLGPMRDEYGDRVFVTSLFGDGVQLYPLGVWKGIEERLQDRANLQHILLRVNRDGLEVELDRQGRVLLPQRLRERTGIVGRVDVIGMGRHLMVWDQARLESKLEATPPTDDDRGLLAGAGI